MRSRQKKSLVAVMLGTGARVEVWQLRWSFLNSPLLLPEPNSRNAALGALMATYGEQQRIPKLEI